MTFSFEIKIRLTLSIYPIYYTPVVEHLASIVEQLSNTI